jgi:hypothetical protein
MTAKISISYSHADDALLARLHKHLAQLQREGSLTSWYDREIHAGSRLDEDIDQELKNADVFIACASPDYIASNYCYDRELESALAREEDGKLAIVPVIFEPCDWLATPLQKFKAVPKDGRPVTEHTNQNVAFLDVVTELRRLLNSLGTKVETKSMSGYAARATSELETMSRYRVQRNHDELHKRDFVESAFQEIYKFFEASVAEISAVPEIEARLSPLSENHFSCTIMNRGLGRKFETLQVRRGRGWGAIDILYGDKVSGSSSHGGFSVDADEYQLYLKPSLFHTGVSEKKIDPREAGQMLWDSLLSKVGIDYA